MLSTLFPNPLETSSVGSSWKDLSNDLKLKIINSFARASKTTSCEQVITLCKDVDYNDDNYKELFLIQVNKLNWPQVRKCLDQTLVIPNFRNNWKDAYAAECNNFHTALATVKNQGWSYELGERFKPYANNTDFILAAINTQIENERFSLLYITDTLKNDPQKADIYREIVLAAVEKDGDSLAYASYELKKDREVVLAAVNKDGLALEFASPELRDDEQVVLAAVNNNGLALGDASLRLQQNEAIVLAAMAQNTG